jgi:prepilin-type N-terminal cleavage/methylation domain-containing protein
VYLQFNLSSHFAIIRTIISYPQNMKTKQKGFTLIELLVVIAIIGLLAGVVLVGLNSARTKARDAKRLSDVRQISTAMDLYYSTCQSYPVVTAATVLGGQSIMDGTNAACGNHQGGSTGDGGIGATTGNNILANVPAAPLPADGTCSTAGPSSGDANPYTYTSFSDENTTTASVSTDTEAKSYSITFCLGGVTGGYSEGPHTLTQSGIQ